MDHRQEQHYDGTETPVYGGGMQIVYYQLHKANGKTISRVRYGQDASKYSDVHQGEYIVFEFSDGTALEIETGSNAKNLADDCRGLKASDFSCDLIASFHEDGKARHPAKSSVAPEYRD